MRRGPPGADLPIVFGGVFGRFPGATLALTLLGSLLALGADRIMFSTDHPLESNQEAVRFIETAPIGEADRAKICHLNAQRLLGL
ncbi:amidohydrolase family protein [Streptomyces sp. NPDC057381]|uniref:amidohydrolase family protein n=1 Tax=unclassified Streptomyces TaxID=2593676 RepID=UPI00363D4B88